MCTKQRFIENCLLLGYCTVSSKNSFPTFRDNISIPSSRVGPDRLSRDVGKELPLNGA